MASGPGYTIADLYYYGGLFGGIIIVYLGTEGMEIHRFVRLIVGLIVGAGLGYVMERAYSNYRMNAYRRQQEQPPEDDRTHFDRWKHQ
jgi:uncharacterized membrane protein YebE (DUF533 family)